MSTSICGSIRHAFVHHLAGARFLIRKFLIEISGFQIVVNVHTRVPAMRRSLLLTGSKSISIGESAIPWAGFRRRRFFTTGTGLRSGKLLLRKNGFTLIINLSWLKSRPKRLSGIIKLLRLLNRRLQLQQGAWHRHLVRGVLYRARLLFLHILNVV